MKPMEKQVVNVRFTKQLLDRIDAYKEEKGFGTRTQAIFYLLQIALDIESKKWAAHVAAFCLLTYYFPIQNNNFSFERQRFAHVYLFPKNVH